MYTLMRRNAVFSIPFSFGLGMPVSGGGGTGTLELIDWSAQVISTHDKDGVSFYNYQSSAYNYL